MKRMHLIGIFIILLILLGLFIMSPFSPLNKSSVNGKSLKIPSGYTIEDSTQYSLVISNETETLSIYYHDQSNLNDALDTYKNKYQNEFNITQQEYTVDNTKVIKTTARRYNKTANTYKNWFVKNDNVYDIQTDNTSPEIEQTVKDIISSM